MADDKQSQGDKGVAIFLDVFRRADKNDDGALSWDEFQTFFNDGIMSSDELLKLFNDIDTHNTNNLDTSEICEYFMKHLGPFAKVYGCLEEMNVAVINALMVTAQEYPNSSSSDKFTVRFLLKEVVSQLRCLGSHLDAALERIDEQERENRPDTIEEEQAFPATSRKMRRMQRQRSYAQQTSVEGPSRNALSGEVDRLAELINKLESKVKLDVVEEEEVDPHDPKQVLLICRKFKVTPDCEPAFRKSFKAYIEGTTTAEGCIQMSTRHFTGTSQFVLYEIWQNAERHQQHFISGESKAFMRENVNNLDAPEDHSKMNIPACWLSE